ncbi:hypothetical protein GCM10027088_51340 [Nocardia goodfellowii]
MLLIIPRDVRSIFDNNRGRYRFSGRYVPECSHIQAVWVPRRVLRKRADPTPRFVRLAVRGDVIGLRCRCGGKDLIGARVRWRREFRGEMRYEVTTNSLIAFSCRGWLPGYEPGWNSQEPVDGSY